jgi:hypothetical protein
LASIITGKLLAQRVMKSAVALGSGLPSITMRGLLLAKVLATAATIPIGLLLAAISSTL